MGTPEYEHKKQYCWVGDGDKFHIQRHNKIKTYCNRAIGESILTDAKAITETFPDGLCKTCLLKYKREVEQ